MNDTTPPDPQAQPTTPAPPELPAYSPPDTGGNLPPSTAPDDSDDSSDGINS